MVDLFTLQQKGACLMKKIICLSLLLSSSTLPVTPYYSIRSQSVNAARELVGAGWNTQINRCDMDEWNGNFLITAEYTRSFRPNHIGRALFDYCGNRCCSSDAFKCYTPCSCPCTPLYGPCCEPGTPCYKPCCTTCCDDDFTIIHISGSQATNKATWDWLADYFGLPTDYKSCVTFEPNIDNFLIDFNFYLGLDKWVEGLYFRIHAPIVHTRWTLNMCEIIENKGTNTHWPSYFNSTLSITETGTLGIARNNLACSFTSFISGCDYIKDNTISFSPLCHAKMNCRRQNKTALSDVQIALGWNFFCNEDYHVGINIRGSAPAGNRPTGEYLFEPIVGNGNHWEAGAGFSAHVVLHQSIDEKKRWGFYADANITHLFKTKQCRTFDLCSKPLSRYMLAAKFDPNVEDLKAGTEEQKEDDKLETPSHQFLGIYTPVANLTTFAVDVSIGLQGDLALMLQHIHGNWSFDLGYNFWGRTCEDIKVRGDYCPFMNNTWGLKGDAFMYGFKSAFDGSITSTAIPLSATQSGATIYDGENNWQNGLDGIAWQRNPGIDNRKLAWDDDKNPLLTLDIATSTTGQVYTSLNPALINFCDIDFNDAQTQGISHKIFAHFDYTWRDCEGMIPYIGLGGELEFGYGKNNNCCNSYNNSRGPRCEPCICTPYSTYDNPNSSCRQYCPLSQWGIWLKGGAAF